MHLSLKNFPPFADREIDLPRLTIVVGQNNVGKSRLLSAATYQSPGLLCFANVEERLHPKSYPRRLGEMRKSGYPMLATCYSPYFVDHVALKEVLVLAQRDGITHMKFLSEHKDAARYEGMMCTGEFWASVGEDWVLPPKDVPVFSTDMDDRWGLPPGSTL